MSDRTERFTVGDRPRLEVRVAAGDLSVTVGDSDTVVVELSGRREVVDGFDVEQLGDTIRVSPGPRRGRRWSRADVHVVAPAGTDVEAHTGSADVTIADASSLHVKAASGDVRATVVRQDAQVSVASGDVVMGRVGGTLTASAAAGDIRVEEVGDRCVCNTASGDISIDVLSGATTIKAASGDVSIGRFSGKDLGVVSLSGDVTVGIPDAWTLEVDLQSATGDIRNQLEPSEGPRQGRSRLKLKTLSGDITLRPA